MSATLSKFTMRFGLIVSILVTFIIAIPLTAVSLTQTTIEESQSNLLQDIKDIKANNFHTCALTINGGVKCWGSNEYGQLGEGTKFNKNRPTDVIDLESEVSEIAVGYNHTCALTTSGGVKCWGDNEFGQLGNGKQGFGIFSSTPIDVSGLTSGIVAITAGRKHTCALTTNGMIKCWGKNYDGQLGDGTQNDKTVPVFVSGLANNIALITAGEFHTCALTDSGGAKCWGNNEFGELGDGTNDDKYTPVDVSGLGNDVKVVSAGGGHTCAVTGNRGAKCWGNNSNGDLGDGTKIRRTTPVDVIGLTNDVVTIATGHDHSCAITTNDGIECWGMNRYGELGNGESGEFSYKVVPVQVSGLSNNVKAIALSNVHSCALTTDGQVKCWGYNGNGQLGDGTGDARVTPVNVSGLEKNVKTLSDGIDHTCAITDSGTVKCWGGGGVGDGTWNARTTPSDVINLPNDIISVTSGSSSCVLTANGGVKCWGVNSSGEIGDGTDNSNPKPVDVIGLSEKVIAITKGRSHTCALVVNGTVKCWGYNLYGRLGNGNEINSNVPVDVIELGVSVVAVAAGDEHTCALTSDGAVKCWGGNGFGALGNGTWDSKSIPIDVMGLTSNVTAITAGWNYSCALTTNRLVKCWGDNSYGQLGDGTKVSRLIPTDVTGLEDVIAIQSGARHTCALTIDGMAKCWGANSHGELGDGTTVDKLTPVNVSVLGKNVSAIKVGVQYTCALTTNGGIKCWGNNNLGQLGDGSAWRTTPVDVLAGDGSELTPTPTSSPTPPASATSTPTASETPLPTGTPISPKDCRSSGKIKVCAVKINNTIGGWTTSGVVQVGELVRIEEGNITLKNGALTGNGLVQLINPMNRTSSNTILRDQFIIDSNTGVLSPRAVSGYQILLSKLAGFTIQQNLYQMIVDTQKGEVRGNINLMLVLPGNNVVRQVNFTLSANETVTGGVSNLNLSLGKVQLNVQQASLSNDGFTIQQAELQLPSGLGGTRATFSAKDARITSDGKFTLAEGSTAINFPNIRVGGTKGFAIEGATAKLSIKSDEYIFGGSGTFRLPGVGSSGSGCGVGVGFTLANSPPPVREAELSIQGCVRIPIATTGFFLTGVNGKVTLDENSVAIDLGVSIEGGPNISGLGSAISGSPSAHWDNSWAVGLSGQVKLFKWNAADADLKLSSKDGLTGILHITVLGVIDGNGSLHVWKENSNFHFTGRADINVEVAEGSIIKKCSGTIITLCVIVPPTSLKVANASSDFGEFRVDGKIGVYGLKGQMSILGYNPAFFVDVDGKVRYDVDGMKEYQLIDTPPLVVANGVLPQVENYKATIGNSEALLVAMAHDSGTITLSLTSPTGQVITSGLQIPGVFYTSTISQTLYTIADPATGEWTITVENRSSNDHYLLSINGVAPNAIVKQRPTIIPNGNSYTVDFEATGAPTATYSLFYDEDSIGNDGRPFLTGISLSQTTSNWMPNNVPNGSYYIYALIDDPVNAPLVSYSDKPIVIADSIPPSVPINAQVQITGTSAIISWEATTSEDIAGYRVYYREPNSGATFVTDIPDGQQQTFFQRGLYLNGNWEISLSAYDINENESSRTNSLVAYIQLDEEANIYLPLIAR